MTIGYFVNVVSYEVNKMEKENLSKRLGLMNDEEFEIKNKDVQVGGIYPIYGMITKFLDENEDELEVELNFSIKAKMIVPEEENVQILKKRSFEPAVFVSEVLSKDDGICVKCNTVVFGKQKDQEMN